MHKIYKMENDDVDLLGHPDNVVASPDRTQIVGISNEGKIIRINLQTLQSDLFSSEAIPQLLAWNGDGNVFYTTRNHRKNFLDSLTGSRQIRFRRNYPYILQVPSYDVQIWVLNLEDGQSRLLYNADAYAIGRLMASPDGKVLFFTQIPNMNSWVENLLSFPEPMDEFYSRFYRMQMPSLLQIKS